MSEPAIADPLHPTGRCTCAGEGRCDWCKWRESTPRLDFTRALGLADEMQAVIDQADQADEPVLRNELKKVRGAWLRACDRHLQRQRFKAIAQERIVSAARIDTILPVFAIELPIHIFPEANRRGHWGKAFKQVGDQRPTIAMAMAAYTNQRQLKLRPPLHITLTRLAPDDLDGGDNLYMSLKHVRDGIADWLKINDRNTALVEYRCLQETRRVSGLRIEIRIPVE